MVSFPYKNIGLQTRPDYPGLEDLVRQIADWLELRGAKLFTLQETPIYPGVQPITEEQYTSTMDMILVLGGDGTFLGGGRLSLKRNIPILGVNLGRLGFLTEITIHELFPVLLRLEKDDVRYENRHVLHARVKREGNIIFEDNVINDAVISKMSIARLLEIETQVDGNFLALFKADGLIISTPTGSTAYSLAAGGPIVFPTMEAIVMTPICAHSLSQRPLVIPDHFTISVRVQTSSTTAALTLDGKSVRSLEEGEIVEIARSPLHLTIIKSPFMSYFDILKSKLRWAEG
jgi:NAD+ kinase